MITLAQFEKWHDELSRLDRTNIDLLLTMPNRDTLIEKFPAGQLHDMVTFGSNLMRVAIKIIGE